MAAMNERPTEDLRCPICGKGVLRGGEPIDELL